MTVLKWWMAAGLVSLCACGPVAMSNSGASTNVTVSGSGVVGVSSGGNYGYSGRGGGGPPSGRTSAERSARRDYYRGPRGNEF